MPIRPTRGYVLIEPEQAEEKTASGFYVPDNSKEKPEKGMVVEVGSPNQVRHDGHVIGGWSDVPFEGKKDSKVYYKKWAGTEVKADGKEYVFVRFEDVLGVIE